MKTRTLSLMLCALLVSSSTVAFAATPVKQNAKCTKLNQKVTVTKVKFQCVKSGSKLVWKKVIPVATIDSVVPGIKPDFTVEFLDGKVWARLNIPTPDYLVSNNIKSVEAVIYANKNSAYLKIGTLQYDFTTWNTKSGNNVNFNWDLKGEYVGSQLAVEAKFGNIVGQGEKALKSIVIPLVTPTPTPTPTPISTPTATPTPTPTPTTPAAEVGCTVNYLSPLPYASQRIALTSITWEKDAQGYVSALATMRNDNSMSLRLVEFKFSAVHKFAVVRFDQTLQGNSFFIKDDPKFNSVDGQAGAWLPGQSRTFRLPSNQMLECRSINVLSSGFTVTQGIGE
jgi:hypothetical protein